MSTPVDRTDGKRLTDIVTATVVRARNQATQRGDVPDWAVSAYAGGMVARAVSAAIVPDGYVVVHREDLAALLRDDAHLRAIFRQRRELHLHLADQEQIQRLRAALDQEGA